MPRLPVLSGREVIRALECLGFVQVRQRGSHVVLQRGTVGCVVALHPEIRVGTLVGIIRQAGLTPDAFIIATER